MFKTLSRLVAIMETAQPNTDKNSDISYRVSDVADEYRKKEFSQDKIKILMITDFSEIFDNYTAIFAVNECNKEQMDIQLDIYGQGRDLEKIQKCIKNQNCSNIRYRGGLQDFTSVYKDYDLFVTASNSVDIRMNTVEALRAGLPLLLIDIEGNGESEFICGNGCLMPKNGIMQFRKALKGFYGDKSQLVTMGQNSRELYEEKYTSKQMVDKTLEVSEE